MLAKVVGPAVFEYHAAHTADSRLEYVLLNGLLLTDGWTIMFESQDTALGLVVNTIRYIEGRTPSEKNYGSAIKVRFTAAMSKWIPPNDNAGDISLREIASALFGEPWCSVVCDTRSDSESLAGLVRATQPEFLPGRLTAGVEQHAAHLPDMTC